jgi:hypothetical protein
MLYGVDEAAGFGDDATGGTGAAVSDSGMDAPAVEAALLRYGAYLGQLHAVTAGHEARFRAIQTGLDASSPLCDSTVDLRDRMDVIHKGLAFLDINPPPGFDDETARMEAALHASDSPFRTLIHGDSGPQNMMDLGERTLLLDFAFADYRHALLDVVSARLGFPHAFRCMRLPDRIVDGLEGAYREALVQAMPEAGDDAAYGRELCYAAAHWSVWRLTAMLRRLVELAERGESIEDAGGHMREEVAALLGQPATRIFDWYRRGVVTGLDATLALPGTGVHLAAMAQVMDAARGQIVARWPDTQVLPVYPVFRDAAADAVK